LPAVLPEVLPVVPSTDTSWQDAFRSRLTLQELLATSTVEFFSPSGRMVGDKQSLKQTIQAMTEIHFRLFQQGWQSAIPVHERVTWSYNRKTARPEDKVYSLLGIYTARRRKKLLYAFARKSFNVAINDSGDSRLLLVARSRREAVVRLLLDRGANGKRKNKCGQTALMLAASNGHSAVVRLLLERGANVDSANRSGHSALHYAVKGGHKETAELLQRSRQSRQARPSKETARSGAQHILRLLNT
ncbi:HET-domain-containing protein, partial [Apiospora phragmitis]